MIARFSNSTGLPSIPDNNPNASPRGLAVRFQLGEHTHTDIVAHSIEAFPVRTAPEFLELLRAIKASTPESPHPTPVEQFLGSHPTALAFVQAPKPFPTSFARENYFAVCAFKFVNAAGQAQHIRYRFLPEAGTEYLDDAGAAAKGADYLMEELAARLSEGPIRLTLVAQLAAEGDVIDDANNHWPADRPLVTLGTFAFDRLVPNNDPDGERIIFDPIPRVAGVEPSADPLLEPRADVYIVSGRRRREALKEGTPGPEMAGH